MGPRVVLVEFKGRLAGLVTVKDCLKYQFKVEAQERGGDGEASRHVERWEERLWGVMQGVGEAVSGFVGRLTKGRVRLGIGERRGERLLGSEGVDPRDEREPIRPIEDEVARDGPAGNRLGGEEEEGMELLERH
ncbi:MAG: hypothetical protein Q9187_009404 [Circinaria calcarea]